MDLIMPAIFVSVFSTCVAFDTPVITVAKTPNHSAALHWHTGLSEKKKWAIQDVFLQANKSLLSQRYEKNKPKIILTLLYFK